ncbi:conserved exported hypothetical protein [Burkholderia sp. 8Y]|uniref:hypothetical protein n=1 Tax=Burkholderia sp. 8Y TaxID=2653133 RepID=UPI0012F32B0E|nr:hypothetical protein [Burkholderia sp. 8Y]VXB45019.1 conserved exported hypothetical protein [Burkholderia sp. 8Y]
MTGKYKAALGFVFAAAAIAATPAYASDTGGASLLLAQATPGNQQRNEGAGVRGGQSGQSGQGASPQGGQGAATQTGTPPAELKRDEAALQRKQAGASGVGGK